MPRLCRITVYPIKSLDGVDVASVELLAAGPLKNDRSLAIFDSEGRLINGKRSSAVQQIRAAYSPDLGTVQLSTAESVPPPARFHLVEDRERLQNWLSEVLGTRCIVREDTESGFPDDVISAGPTIISTGTLKEVARWFDLPDEEVRRRFRPNLEIDAVEPFWEDRLCGASRQRPTRFQIGVARFYGINPCERCVVPTRESTTGIPLHGFARRFAKLRLATLPQWASQEAFDHYYRLTINTRLAPSQHEPVRVQLGDDVTFESAIL